MLIRNRIAVALTSAALMAVLQSGIAHAAVGQFQFSQGDVKIVDRTGKARAAVKGSEIDEGEMIVTAPSASAQLKMIDGGIIAVRPDTQLRVDTYVFKGKEDGSERGVMSLLRGGFRTITGTIGRFNKDNYKIATPSATIGIRGTDHEPIFIPPALAGQAPVANAGTYDKVNVGEAYISTPLGSVNIRPNQVGYVAPGGTPQILPVVPGFYRQAPTPIQAKGEKEKEQAAASKPAEEKKEGKKGDAPQQAAAPAEQSAPVRATAVVDPTTTTPTGGTTVTVAPAAVANAPVLVVTATDAAGTTVNTTTQTLTSSSGTEAPLTQGAYAIQAQSAADAALLAATAAQTAANTTAATQTTLTGIAQVNTSPATAAISTATTGIGTSATAVTTATALTPTPTTAPTTAINMAATAATQAATAQTALSTNAAFADVTAGPANTATQAANSTLQAAKTAVDTAISTMVAQNTALAAAQAAATTALGTANANLAAAQTALNNALAQNTLITTAQGSTATQLTAAQTAATAAQTAAAASQAAATQAATLQAAGDFSGAQAKLDIAQQQLALAQQQQAAAQAAQTAVATQLSTAQTAQTTGTANVTSSANAATSAQTAASTASTQAAAATTASTLASNALASENSNLATIGTNAALVAANAPIAAYKNPAVVTSNRFIGVMSTVTPVTGGYIEGYGPGAGFTGGGTTNTSFVLDGAGNLVESRHTWYEETPASTATPQLLVADANVKRTGGSAAETFKLADNSIYGGRWTGGSITVTDNATVSPVPAFTRSLGSTSSDHWAIMLSPPINYVQTLVGTTTYTKVAATSPTDASGNVGVLNNASLSADFTNQLVSAGVNLTISSKTLDVQAPNMPINGAGFSKNSIVPTCTGCSSTYYANVGGMFAGDAAASAGLSYSLWTGQPPGSTAPATDLIQGLVAFSTATAPTALAGGPLAAYTATNTAVAYTGAYGGGFSYIAAPGDVMPLGNPTTFTERFGDNYGLRTDTLVGASTATSPTTVAGITYGVWETVTSVNALEQHRIEPNGYSIPTYMYGAEGYLDSSVIFSSNTGPMTGTFTYSQVAATSYDPNTWATGSVTTATMSADFTNQTVTTGLSGTMGTNNWTANSTDKPINFMNPTTGAGARFYDNAPVITVNTVACSPNCGGNINGAFIGQNYAGAIVQYSIWDNNNLNVNGLVAFNNTPVVGTGGTPTGTFVVANSWQIESPTAITTDGTGVLTGWSGMGWNSTVTPVGSVAQTPVGTGSGTINWGEWGAGSGGSTAFSYPPGFAQLHWITAPEPTPVYLAQVLTGTATYNFVGGDVTSLSGGGHGTISSGSTSLAVNFTNQSVAANLGLSVNGHAWAASTPNAPLQSAGYSQGMGSTGFYADSDRPASQPGYLTVTMDGAAANGNLTGQLVGSAMDGAILKFNLDGAVITPTLGYEWVQGVAAFSAATPNDPTTSYRPVLFAVSEPSTTEPIMTMGGDYNNAGRVVFDGGGTLSQFDSFFGDKDGKSIQRLSGGFADQGSDPLTGISWGRWTAGTSAVITDRPTGATQTVTLSGGSQWIAGPVMNAPVALPTTGTYNYALAGGTSPTDQSGNSGTLNSASLSANFTAQTVNVGVNVTAGGATMVGLANGVPINQRSSFYTDSMMPGASALAVTCTGTCGTTANHGAIGGAFAGTGGVGAAMVYGFQKVGGTGAGTISGVAAFHR